MDKKQKEILITIVLVIVFIGASFYQLSKGMKRPKRKSYEKEMPAPPDPSTSSKKGLDLSQLEELPWGRDPFVKASKPKPVKEKDRFTLSAVIWDENEPYAVINDEILVVGQEIEEYHVIDIDVDTVILQKGSKEIKLKLYN